MLEYSDNVRGVTTAIVKTTDDIIPVNPALATKLNNLKDGNHIYLTLRYLDRYEVVKFTKDGDIKQNKISVQRDVNGTGRKNFPCDICISADWSAVQMHEYICQVKGGCNEYVPA